MPFLRQAHGVKLRRIPNNVALHPPTVRLASHSSKHKKNHVDRDPQAKARPDHNEARYGKRQKAFWKSMTPDFLTQETKASSEKSGLFSQASAFRLYASHKSGSEPIVEASSASWNSKTDEVSHTIYDPISGRMVPIPAKKEQTRQVSTSAKSKKHNHSPGKVYQKPSIMSQLQEDTDALSNTPTTHASLTEDFDKTYQSEHDELLAARRHLDTLREQIQILERQTHPEMTKPQYAVDAERPAVFEDGWDNNPKGLQTAFRLEKEACEHGKAESLEREMDALNKRPVQKVNDDYSISPSGMETLFANEQRGNDISHQSTLEQELLAMNTVTPPVDDGYSPSPQGLETLFEQEQSGGRTLEDEVRMTGSAPSQLQYIDGVAKGPTGLETAYEREQLGTSTLEHELENMASSPTVSDLNGAYSTKPFGLETLYEREAEGNQKDQHESLENEIHDHIQTLDRYSSANLDGLQTLWKREQESVETGSARSLEDEIMANQQPQIAPNEYDMSPFGMETHFRDETQRTGDGKIETLEEEVKRKLQARIQEDGYSHSPSGLETAFQNEEKDTILGNRQTLEKEINSLEPGFEDVYSTTPVGLQMMFHREKESGGRSLEEDLKQVRENETIVVTGARY
ncbi:hypothetical protein E4T45_09669 [Aureobasidium sp. EXF-8846]|nr:hypothetical protein E4T45_09669 [Aureobasidium sp. EXF-8846]